MNSIKKQLFLSHTWNIDNLNRNNHNRVIELSKKLNNCGWSTWIDEENIIGNIDAAMADGIDKSEAMIICLTESYLLKVNESAKDPRIRDNCLKEWTYGNARNKLMIPVIMEPSLLNVKNWPPGIVSLYFGTTLYIDASKDNLNNAVIHIHEILQKYNLNPNIVNNNNKKLSEIIERVNNIISVDKSNKIREKNKSNNNLLSYLIFNKKIFENKNTINTNNSIVTSPSKKKLNNKNKRYRKLPVQKIYI
mgnify:CR=1 FL=1|tara:strand:- start:3173 stop:3919 length:747 start_codon:yes stop_codon:yes gene_type:complete